MEVELFIHGVPSGEGFWGKEEDRNYFGTFYDHSSDEVKFLIQTRALKGKPYCYYNYLVYKTVGAQTPNIVANDGRDGSYFGITLRLDAYCKDIVNMYRILDTVFNVYVMGNLLKMEKTKLKYTTPDFASVSNVLEGIEKTTIQLIQNAFSNDSFAHLDGFAITGGKCRICNLYDCTPDSVMATVKKYSRMAVSPYYPSAKETAILRQCDAQIQAIQQQCDAQIQAIQQQCDARIKADADAHIKERNGINTSLLSAQNKISELQREIVQKDESIRQLNRDLSHLQSELNNIGQSKKMGQIVESIREPITELSEILKHFDIKTTERTTQDKEKKQSKKKKKSDISVRKIWKSYFSFVVPLLLLATIGTFLIFKCKPVKDSEISKTNSVAIKIEGYSDGDLLLDTIYFVEAINGTKNGRWKADGCKLFKTENPNIVKIRPEAKNVKIEYHIGKEVQSKSLKAK